jgi:hypothetical protein
MFEVIPDKRNFMNHTVTDNHILTLKVRDHKKARTHRGKIELMWFDKTELKFRYKDFSNEDDLKTFKATIEDDDVIDITIEKYMELPQYTKDRLFLFKSEGINWPHKDVALDPYILGMWLGDGSSSGSPVDQELLAEYNLVNNKHIPLEYLVNDRETRLKLLAGLIDTDGSVRASGHEVRICQGERNYQLIYDIEFLARSLGFSCYLSDGVCSYTVGDEKRQKPYKELTITGKDLYEIPTILNKFENPSLNKNSVSQSANRLQSSFKLVEKPVQPFVGWQLEGNGRFLLGDMSVSHNTPEGASVGLVKNLSMAANVTISSNSTHVRELLESHHATCMYSPDILHELNSQTRIVVNGDIIGFTRDPLDLFQKLKVYKRSGCINITTGVVWNIKDKEISVSTEGGRCVRPLIVVGDKNKLSINLDTYTTLMDNHVSWQDVLIHHNNVVEFVDVEEGNTSMIAMKYTDLLKPGKGNSYPLRYTHIELHPSLMLGALASCIPFSDHNQAPRNCYQASQGKQALGIYASNYRHRYDTLAHVMNYPQRPLVRTKMSKYLNNDTLPCGINAIVAIATYTGFNQEDSIIMNQSAIDRGLFTSTYFRTYKEQNNKNHSNGEEEFFTKPDMESSRASKPHQYDKLEDDGFVPENTFVTTGDVIIGKCMPNKNGSTISYKDNSVSIKNNESGFIDRNCYNDKHFININGDGYNFCKVRMRSERIPTIGDKFSARSAQKGTVGMIYRQEDMPFTKDGIVPDLIMNPHAIPSRMTIGQLLECVMGKACVMDGVYGNSTPFNEVNVEDIADILEEAGMERYGNEILYNSRTGEQITTQIFIGPTFYQRLKHMTADKMHSRGSSGPIVLLTRQPAEGRARDGGLRIGEMELECNWAHGIFQFLKERLMECSDNYRVFVCKNCGNMANVNPERNIYNCRNCKNITKFAEVRIPYACKLLFQEIQTMGIGAKFNTQ